MADSSSSSTSSKTGRPGSKPGGEKKSSLGFLGRKIGPVPIWLIGLGIFGVYYWYTHYGPGAQKQQQASKQQQGRRRGRGGGTRVIIIRDNGRQHRRHKPHPRGGTMTAGPRGGGNVGGGMTAAALGPTLPADQAGQLEPGGPVAEGGAPVYAAYQQYYGAQGGDGAEQPVPEPSQAYAPMTAGAIYG